jgi:hypothetical protein
MKRTVRATTNRAKPRGERRIIIGLESAIQVANVHQRAFAIEKSVGRAVTPP